MDLDRQRQLLWRGTGKILNTGWVKLHRKTLENDIYRFDPTAWRVFMLLLLIVDRKSGTWKGGRFQLAQQVGGDQPMKSTTLYDALKRLEKAKMATLKPNNRFTVITICKWSEYQGNGDTKDRQPTDNQPTTDRQPTDTLTRSKKVRSKNNSLKTITDNRDPQITRLINHFETNIGKMPRPTHQAYAAATLIQTHGFTKSIGGINAAATARGDRYGPSIATLEELVEKWVKLETYWKRQTIKGRTFNADEIHTGIAE